MTVVITTSLRYTCDDRDERRRHGAKFLTDKQPHTTWWQSQTLDAADLQYPNNVTLTINLEKAGLRIFAVTFKISRVSTEDI